MTRPGWMEQTLRLVAAAFAVVLVGASVSSAASKPRVAVLQFQNKAGSQWWWHGGAEAMQDVFVTELVKGGRFRVTPSAKTNAALKRAGLGLTLSGDLDPATAVKAGKLLGVNYLLTGAVTEYGLTDVSGRRSTFVAAANARLIDTSTGEIVWADEARAEESVLTSPKSTLKRRAFTSVAGQVVRSLAASLKAANSDVSARGAYAPPETSFEPPDGFDRLVGRDLSAPAASKTASEPGMRPRRTAARSACL